ncbi:UDP-glycosyltransferase BMGT2 [Striga asiatica]|uniref:UDP-glycosyltransferase BMGT2 n=1 Tax=Striga asiatica TaxID=4170 RepID=A0A5A7QBR5_STRAF|nr:UDP-glycosyltransferase BMGT2 [Striga asiatica]
MIGKIDVDVDIHLDAKEFGALYAVMMADAGGDKGDDGEEDVRKAFTVKMPEEYWQLRWRREGQLQRFLADDVVQRRTKGRGFVIKSLAPQKAVLELAAVAGFVTHRGRSSILEAVTCGMSMIGWSIYEKCFMESMDPCLVLSRQMFTGHGGHCWISYCLRDWFYLGRCLPEKQSEYLKKTISTFFGKDHTQDLSIVGAGAENCHGWWRVASCLLVKHGEGELWALRHELLLLCEEGCVRAGYCFALKATVTDAHGRRGVVHGSCYSRMWAEGQSAGPAAGGLRVGRSTEWVGTRGLGRSSLNGQTPEVSCWPKFYLGWWRWMNSTRLEIGICGNLEHLVAPPEKMTEVSEHCNFFPGVFFHCRT